MEQESNQGGAATEETSEAPSTEAKTTSRVEDTPEYRNMQSQKDKEAARAMKAEQAVESMQNQLNELQSSMERQRKEDRQRRLEALSDDPEKQKELMAKFDFDDYKNRELQGINMAWKQVGELMTQYNLPTSAIGELQKATNPDHMIDIAKRIAMEQPKVETPVAKEPPETPAPDSGTTDMGGKRVWTADEVANLSSDQYAKYEKEIIEQQRQGLIK